MSKFDQFSDNSKFSDARQEFINEEGNLDIKIQEYFAIYLDPQTMDYYQALSFPLPDDVARIVNIPQLRPMEISNGDRITPITNLKPSLRIYADTASRNKLWGKSSLKYPTCTKVGLPTRNTCMPTVMVWMIWHVYPMIWQGTNWRLCHE